MNLKANKIKSEVPSSLVVAPQTDRQRIFASLRKHDGAVNRVLDELTMDYLTLSRLVTPEEIIYIKNLVNGQTAITDETIRQAVRDTRGNKTKAAEELEISVSKFKHLIELHGLEADIERIIEKRKANEEKIISALREADGYVARAARTLHRSAGFLEREIDNDPGLKAEFERITNQRNAHISKKNAGPAKLRQKVALADVAKLGVMPERGDAASLVDISDGTRPSSVPGRSPITTTTLNDIFGEQRVTPAILEMPASVADFQKKYPDIQLTIASEDVTSEHLRNLDHLIPEIEASLKAQGALEKNLTINIIHRTNIKKAKASYNPNTGHIDITTGTRNKSFNRKFKKAATQLNKYQEQAPSHQLAGLSRQQDRLLHKEIVPSLASALGSSGAVSFDQFEVTPLTGMKLNRNSPYVRAIQSSIELIGLEGDYLRFDIIKKAGVTQAQAKYDPKTGHITIMDGRENPLFSDQLSKAILQREKHFIEMDERISTLKKRLHQIDPLRSFRGEHRNIRLKAGQNITKSKMEELIPAIQDSLSTQNVFDDHIVMDVLEESGTTQAEAFFNTQTGNISIINGDDIHGDSFRNQLKTAIADYQNAHPLHVASNMYTDTGTSKGESRVARFFSHPAVKLGSLGLLAGGLALGAAGGLMAQDLPSVSHVPDASFGDSLSSAQPLQSDATFLNAQSATVSHSGNFTETLFAPDSAEVTDYNQVINNAGRAVELATDHSGQSWPKSSILWGALHPSSHFPSGDDIAKALENN
ncbi:MAG: hypothetical protein ABIJ41_02105, partial [Candidatus Omnitrophota bacterium]